MTRFNILFIKPHSSVHPQAIDVPLGIMYLSAYAKHVLGDTVNIDFIDLRLARHPRQALSRKLTAFTPDLIGISLLAFDNHFIPGYAAFLKQWAPNASIVIGGPHATYNDRELLEHHREIDFAVRREGEQVFVNLMSALINQTPVSAICGISYMDGDGGFVHTEPAPYIDDLDGLPFPDYEILDLPQYWKNHDEMNGVRAKKRYTHIISSRACPYQCTYCHNIFGKRVRRRSPGHFVAEIQWLYDTYGIREFHIVDDIFNIHRRRMHDILNRIIQSPMRIKIAFPNGVRSDLLEKEDILLLKKAGVYMMTFAIETASDHMQQQIKKNLDLQKAFESINHASNAGMITKGFFMLGFPGETPAEIEQTIAAACGSKLDLAHFFTVTPFPGTELGETARQMYPGLTDSAEFHYWPRDPFYQQATGYNLARTQKMAYLRFYGPRILRTFIKVPRKLPRLVRWWSFAMDVLFRHRADKESRPKGPGFGLKKN
ncbi:MAG: radical SAM protein [Thermodesulfobacteriota bacterium]|nr:radical SAM protein [Thermodesulfobacteriota bacterium]